MHERGWLAIVRGCLLESASTSSVVLGQDDPW
jgi:hypothetical protein